MEQKIAVLSVASGGNTTILRAFGPAKEDAIDRACAYIADLLECDVQAVGGNAHVLPDGGVQLHEAGNGEIYYLDWVTLEGD